MTCLLMRFQLVVNREGTDAFEDAEAVYSALLNCYFDAFACLDFLGLHQLLGQSDDDGASYFSSLRQSLNQEISPSITSNNTQVIFNNTGTSSHQCCRFK